MIRSLRDKRTVAVYLGLRPKEFPAGLFVVAARKLRYLDAANRLENLRVPPGNRLEALAWPVGAPVNTASESTTSGASAFGGGLERLMTSRLWTTTKMDTCHDPA